MKKPTKKVGFLCPGLDSNQQHPCERCDLNTVRLPISPPGLFRECKFEFFF